MSNSPNSNKKKVKAEPKEESYKLISGRYKGYEVCWTSGGQIFPRAGWYLQKTTKSGKVENILYLESALRI